MGTNTKIKSLNKLDRLERGLRDRSIQLKSILSAAPVGIGMVQDRVIKEVNPYFCEMLGYKRHELIDQSSRMLYASDEEYSRVGNVKYEQIAAKGKGKVETELLRKDGKTLNILLTSVSHDPSDYSRGITFTALDITEKKQDKQALSTSEKRSSNLIKTSPMGILIYQIDQKGKLILIDANPASEAILGQDFRGSIGQTIQDIFPGLADTHVPETYRKVALGGENWSTTDFQYQDDLITGAYDVLAFQIAPGQVAVMFSDITERKQTEQKLQLSEEKHRKIFQNIQDVYFELAPDSTILEISPSLSKISKYTREELIGKSIQQMVVDEKINNVFLDLLFKRGELKDFDIPLKDKDDRIVNCSVNIKIEKNEAGVPEKIIGSLRDITERKLAREKISKLERAVEQSPSSVVITNLDGNIEYVNPKFCEVTGYTREEAMGHNPSILKSGEQEPAFYEELWSTISGGNEWKGEFHNMKKDGTTFWEMASISPVRIHDLKYVLLKYLADVPAE